MAGRGPSVPTGAPARAELPKSSADDVAAVFVKEAKAIAEQAATQAKGGDVAAMRLVLDRVAPAPKERNVRFSLPVIDSAKDLPRAVLALTDAVSRGELTPGEATQMAGVLEQYRKQVETADLAERIEALEQANGR